MKIDLGTVVQLVSLFGGLIGEGKRGGRIAALMNDIDGQLDDLKAARETIDQMARAV